MRRVLLTGAGGYLAGFVRQYAPPDVELILQSRTPINITPHERFLPFSIDIAKWEELENPPHTIIHAAAMASVDACEENPEEAMKVNIGYTRAIIKYARKVNARVLYISSDQVLSGNAPMSTESALPEPVNFYGWTKWMCERYILQTVPEALVLRPALIYGPPLQGNSGFTVTAVEKMKAGESVSAFVDQFRTPILVSDLARIIWKCVETPLSGLYNAAGPERLSRYDMVHRICKILGLPTSLIRPVKMTDVSLKAHRGKDCSLDASKLMGQLNYKPVPYNTAIRNIFR